MTIEAQASVWPTIPNQSYYRARYYDPNLGRFLSEDPVRFGIGPTVRNLRSGAGAAASRLMLKSALRGRAAVFYSYVTNNAVNGTDPSGLWQFTVGGGFDFGGRLQIGHNNGHWSFGLAAGAGEGAFFSLDPETKDCDCGWTLGAEGDVGFLENVGITIEENQNYEVSGSLDYTDPVNKVTWSWSPFDPQEPPRPSWGIGAGFFAGVGYTWCF